MFDALRGVDEDWVAYDPWVPSDCTESDSGASCSAPSASRSSSHAMQSSAIPAWIAASPRKIPASYDRIFLTLRPREEETSAKKSEASFSIRGRSAAIASAVIGTWIWPSDFRLPEAIVTKVSPSCLSRFVTSTMVEITPMLPVMLVGVTMISSAAQEIAYAALH